MKKAEPIGEQVTQDTRESVKRNLDGGGEGRHYGSWKELHIHESISIDCGSPKENETFLSLLTEI